MSLEEILKEKLKISFREYWDHVIVTTEEIQKALNFKTVWVCSKTLEPTKCYIIVDSSRNIHYMNYEKGEKEFCYYDKDCFDSEFECTNQYLGYLSDRVKTLEHYVKIRKEKLNTL